MVFRGQLASILVCDTCKKISVTTEDFHDLSLSIKPEDYISKDQRKRDRFKGIAKKLRLIPKARVDRSSSVPASPARSSLTLPSDHLEVSGEPVDTRRRSLEHVVGNGVTEEVKEGSAVAEEAVLSEKEKAPNGDLSDAAPKEEGGHVSFADSTLPGSQKRDDGWGKLGRRISMSMGGAARKEKRLSQSKSNSRASSRERVPAGPPTPRLVASSPLADDDHEVWLVTIDVFHLLIALGPSRLARGLGLRDAACRVVLAVDGASEIKQAKYVETRALTSLIVGLFTLSRVLDVCVGIRRLDVCVGVEKSCIHRGYGNVPSKYAVPVHGGDCGDIVFGLGGVPKAGGSFRIEASAVESVRFVHKQCVTHPMYFSASL